MILYYCFYDLYFFFPSGLRRIGVLLETAPVIEKCFSNSSNPMSIRLAALDVISEMNCQNGRRFESLLIRFVGNANEDSELRIAAYLGLTRCPDTDTVNVIKEVLVDGEVSQGKRCV